VNSSNRFVGAWHLISWETRSLEGEVSYPVGHDTVGYIIYSATGYMSVAIMFAQRQFFAAGDLLAGSQEERAAAAATYVSYAGRYETLEDKVVHYIEVSLFPNWTGSRQERFYEFTDNRLILSTAPILAGGVERRHYLVWEQAATVN